MRAAVSILVIMTIALYTWINRGNGQKMDCFLIDPDHHNMEMYLQKKIGASENEKGNKNWRRKNTPRKWSSGYSGNTEYFPITNN